MHYNGSLSTGMCGWCVTITITGMHGLTHDSDSHKDTWPSPSPQPTACPHVPMTWTGTPWPGWGLRNTTCMRHHNHEALMCKPRRPIKLRMLKRRGGGHKGTSLIPDEHAWRTVCADIWCRRQATHTENLTWSAHLDDHPLHHQMWKAELKNEWQYR